VISRPEQARMIAPPVVETQSKLEITRKREHVGL
jgi:hypothetical protein